MRPEEDGDILAVQVVQRITFVQAQPAAPPYFIYKFFLCCATFIRGEGTYETSRIVDPHGFALI